MESQSGSSSFRRNRSSGPIYGQALETPSREPTWDIVRTFLARKCQKKKKKAPTRVVEMRVRENTEKGWNWDLTTWGGE